MTVAFQLSYVYGMNKSSIKRMLILLLIFVFSFTSMSFAAESGDDTRQSDFGEKVASIAEQYANNDPKYKYGDGWKLTTKDHDGGIDCVRFCIMMYEKAGSDIVNSANRSKCYPVEKMITTFPEDSPYRVKLSGRLTSAGSELKRGDIICFGDDNLDKQNYPNNTSGVRHLGIYIGGGKIAHASGYKDGVCIGSLSGCCHDGRYIKYAFRPYDAAESAVPSEHQHKLQKIEGKAPTCTESGYKEYYKCDDCNKLFADKDGNTEIKNLEAWKNDQGLLPELGHDFGEWTVEKEPTATEEGLEKRVCRRDPSHVETRAIPRINTEKHEHKLVKIDGVPATAKKDGYKDYYKCTDCNKLFADSEAKVEIEDLEAWKNGEGKISMEKEKVTVTLDADNGTGETETVILDKGSIYKLPASTFKAPENKEFDKWDKGAIGDQITVDTDITVKAQWKEIEPVPAKEHRVTVIGGTSSVESATEGTVVTIDATNPSPDTKKFKEWKSVSGEVLFADTYDGNTTFTMPDSDVEVKAVFEDKVPKKEIVSDKPANKVPPIDADKNENSDNKDNNINTDKGENINTDEEVDKQDSNPVQDETADDSVKNESTSEENAEKNETSSESTVTENNAENDRTDKSEANSIENNKTAGSNIVKTDDPENPLLNITVLVLAVLGLVTTLIYRKKKIQ